jgi:hypothetical protein
MGTHHLFTLPMPTWVFKIVAGETAIESAFSEIKINNERLRNTGFEFQFPTVREGIPDIVREFKREKQFLLLIPLLFVSIVVALFSVVVRLFANKAIVS